MELRFAVLGRVRAWRSDAELELGSAKQTAVLMALVLARGKPVSVERIVSAVWGDDAPRAAGATVRTYIYRLRQVFSRDGAEGISSVPGGYAFCTLQAVDVWQFEDLVTQVTRGRESGDPDDELSLVNRALELWKGEPLAGVPGPFAEQQRALYSGLRLAAVERRMACLLKLGEDAQAAAELSSLVAAHPLHEGLRELLMVALYRTGRQVEALEAYTQAQESLRDELGMDPTPRLHRMYLRIIRNDTSLSHSMPADEDVPSPAAAPPAAAVPPAAAALPAAPAATRPTQLPAATQHFVGRGTELDTLTRMIGPNWPTAPAPPLAGLVVGMPGVGKTTLALRWAHLISDRFPDGQLFADLSGFSPQGRPRSANSVLRDFLSALGAPAERIPRGQEAAAGLYRSLLAGKRVLVVLDDAASSRQVTDLIPGTPGSSAIITSRTLLARVEATHQAPSLRVRPFSDAEARDILIRRLGRDRVDADPQAAEDILAVCGGLPSALSFVIGRALRTPSLPIAAIAAQLSDGTTAFEAERDPVLNIRARFFRSYTALSRPAAHLLARMTGEPGPVAIASASRLVGWSARDTSSALAELSVNHLLEEHADGSYSIHPLVRLLTADAGTSGCLGTGEAAGYHLEFRRGARGPQRRAGTGRAEHGLTGTALTPGGERGPDPCVLSGTHAGFTRMPTGPARLPEDSA